VSSLRHYFAHVQTNLESKTEANKELEKEVKECKEEIQRLRTWASSRTGQVAPSMDTLRRETDIANQVPSPVGNAGKLYSEAVRAEGGREKRYKLKITSRTNHSGDAIKNIIKTSVNPTSMKVGICALKSLWDGRVIMETKSKEELELLYTNINDKCSQLLEANIQKPRNPKLVIYNILEEISAENAEEIITTQNPELMLNAGEVQPKFTYRGKRNIKNLVIEVGPQTRQKIFNTKLKIGWHICNMRDYVVVNRCFKCSRFNHRASNCRGEETCPLCMGGHTKPAQRHQATTNALILLTSTSTTVTQR
jgi:ribosomal protein L29